ncbi:Cmx/CmrA family chloramphenicol efflux MFS transporter [Streptomyces sp. NPDC048290]|uniref:Cmx/CmrA family chloramphenicol efflux MFS transporter n=1 Tax=Streptomyces sp. NPDC048290 TaxID=3155811 RepID=UPI003419E8C1
MPLFLHVLSLAVFAQGTSEFMLAGLVPGIAADLSVSTGAAASLTSAYAVGMVLGAPVMAALGARLPRRRALAGFLTAFVAVHLVGALTGDFAVLFATRVIAAVTNAGFLAVAMSVAHDAVPAERRARATAVLLSGVTLACVVGVPAGAALGDFAGWRAAFWAVAALCLPALALVFRSAPADAAAPVALSVRTEARVLRSRPVRVALLLGALVNGATFATFGYLAVLATEVTGLAGSAVPGLLAAFGVGASAGVAWAGRTADGTLKRDLRIALLALPAAWAVLALGSTSAWALLPLAVLLGALSFGVGASLINRVMHTAADAPVLAGSFATVGLNAGAFAGPLLAATAAGAGQDARFAVAVSVALSAAAGGVLLADRARHRARAMDRRNAGPGTADRRTSDPRPTADPRPAEGRTADRRTSDPRPAGGRTADGPTADPRPTDPRPADGHAVDGRHAEAP